jgi:phosphate transport system substrate-binding protein
MKSRPLINKVFTILVGFILALSPYFFPSPARADVLEIPGTGACEVLLRALADAFNKQHPGHQVSVPPSIGSSGGMRLVVKDKAILVRVARPLKEEEEGQGLTYLPFAHDMIIFAVGAKVPIRSITTAQLADVYAGKTRTWQELGGPPAPIRVLLRQPGETNLKILKKDLKPLRDITFTPHAKVLFTDPDMLAAIQKYTYSIGFITYSSLKGVQTTIYPLALDGIAPTPANVQSRRYNIGEEYALVFRENRLNDLAKSFLNFLFSQNGEAVIKQYGVIPVKRK